MSLDPHSDTPTYTPGEEIAMKILHQPESKHDCGYGLWELGDRPVGTIVACICGRKWECVGDGFLTFLTFRRVEPGNCSGKLWRSAGHITVDWDDLPGEEVTG